MGPCLLTKLSAAVAPALLCLGLLLTIAAVQSLSPTPPLKQSWHPLPTSAPVSNFLAALQRMAQDSMPSAVLDRAKPRWQAKRDGALTAANLTGYTLANQLTDRDDMPNGIWATVAVAPSKLVAPQESLTVFGSWSSLLAPQAANESEPAVCHYQCLFDFGIEPAMAWHMADPLDPWVPPSFRRVRGSSFFSLSPAGPSVKLVNATWSDNGGRLLKCPAPGPPPHIVSAREKLNDIVSALVSVRLSCNRGEPNLGREIPPTAAKVEYGRRGHDLPNRAVLDKTKIVQQAFPNEGSSDFFCSCTMIRDDAERLREWIEYHKILGITRFIFYDNNSTDNTKLSLKPYIDDGSVKLVNWHYLSTTGSFGPQSQAFSHCLETFGARGSSDSQPTLQGNFQTVYSDRHHARAAALRLPQCEWIAFTDVDEYIVPKPFQPRSPDDKSLLTYLRDSTYQIDKDGNSLPWGGPGSVYIPSFLFGHSNHVRNPPGLRIRNFSQRWFSTDSLGKSIAHRRSYPALQNIIHLFNWPPDEANIPNAAGTSMAGEFDMVFGADFSHDPSGMQVITSTANKSPLEAAVYHYATGSWEDYLKKWNKPRDRHGECAINTTFAETFPRVLASQNEAMRWPTTSELLNAGFYGTCFNEAVETRNQTLENTNYINATDTGDELIGIRRYYDLVERNLARINRRVPVS